MGMIYLLVFSCAPEQLTFDTSVDEVQQAESFAVDLSDLQDGLDWFFMELSAMRVSELLKFEADMVIVDSMCPQPFPVFFQTTAWNNGCTTMEEVSLKDVRRHCILKIGLGKVKYTIKWLPSSVLIPYVQLQRTGT